MMLPSFWYLFQSQRPRDNMMRRVNSLLKAAYNEEGSNNFHLEKSAYSVFAKYLKEVNVKYRNRYTGTKL